MPHVMKYGLVHNDSPFASDSFVPIDDMSVMDARSTKQLPDGSFLSRQRISQKQASTLLRKAGSSHRSHTADATRVPP